MTMGTHAGKPRSRASGMTLVELLVAIAIMGIALPGLMTVMTTAVKNMRTLQKQLDMTQKARIALERMTRELATAFHPYGMYDGNAGTRTDLPWFVVQAAASNGEEISFIAQQYQTNEFTTPGAGDLVEIHYYVGVDGSYTHLYRRKEEGTLGTLGGGSTNSYTTSKWAGDDATSILAEYVNDLQFTVWDRTGTSSSTYNYTGTQTAFPSRIRISIRFYDPDGVAAPVRFAVDVSVMRNSA